MKVLLDTYIWGGAKHFLIEASHDVVWTGDWQQDPGDEEILAYAHREKRVLITQDKDFGELAIVRGNPHCGIIRLSGYAGREQGKICAFILQAYEKDIAECAIITVNKNRIRIRPA